MDAITCPRCHTPVDYGNYRTGGFSPCPSCRASLRIDLFPALLRPIVTGASGHAVMSEEASCFYHPGKRAETTCDYCGRFLCSLCDMELGGSHLCPSCLEAGQKKGRLVDLERHRVLYDSTALKIAILPLIIFWFTLVTAPMALYLSIRHWKSPGSIVRRGRWRFIVAMLLSSLEILGWAFGIVYFISLRH